MSESENGHRPIINAPFLEVTLGAGSLGDSRPSTGARLVSIGFEGLYPR